MTDLVVKKPKVCAECRKPFSPRARRQTICSVACRRKRHRSANNKSMKAIRQRLACSSRERLVDVAAGGIRKADRSWEGPMTLLHRQYAVGALAALKSAGYRIVRTVNDD